MVTDTQIQNLVNEIVEGYKPEKIYLFGSYANGTPNEDSDIDLFIVKETDKRKIERSWKVKEGIKNYPPVGLDVFVFTPKELEIGFLDVINIGKEAVKTGKILYEKL
jgi:predicted nucleotidyltransferase